MIQVLYRKKLEDGKMRNLNIYREWGEELERGLRLKTFPIALKLLAKEADIPKEAQRPLRDFGYHYELCQSFQLSRRSGITIAMLKEDHWCCEPVIGFGLGEPPEFFLEGHNRYPRDVETLEAGKNYAEEFPRLEVGKYIGTVSAPLRTTSFEPDVVMIYCDSAQLCLLLLGREYRDGRNLKCALSGHAACVYGVVPSLKSGQCQVAVPCRGDRYEAMAGDEEMIFTIPKGRLEDLILGLRQIEKTGSKLPRGYAFLPECPMSPNYDKIAKLMGFIK
jgi:uncharacterized protein (DUF169 family)